MVISSLDLFCRSVCVTYWVFFVLCRVFGTSMVEEYEEIADSQYPSERLEYLDEDYGKMLTSISNVQISNLYVKDQKWMC